MKDFPVIFSTSMVRAIIEGRKTQFRHVIRPQPKSIEEYLRDLQQKRIDRKFKVGNRIWVREKFIKISNGGIAYFATASKDELINYGGNWTKAEYMRKKQSRITLAITGAREERLQDISEEDVIREGMTSKDDFKKLWIPLSGIGSYESNPIVNVINFKVM